MVTINFFFWFDAFTSLLKQQKINVLNIFFFIYCYHKNCNEILRYMTACRVMFHSLLAVIFIFITLTHQFTVILSIWTLCKVIFSKQRFTHIYKTKGKANNKLLKAKACHSVGKSSHPGSLCMLLFYFFLFDTTIQTWLALSLWLNSRSLVCIW